MIQSLRVTRRVIASLLMLLTFAGLQFYAQANLAQTSASSTTRELTVLYTNDEHGWMVGREAGKGAADLMGLWREREGYTEDGAFLILSGGDNWTGPAISTWFEGASMVELMNAMDYDASAVGNHEFDFGTEVLRQRASEANYPYLSANTRRKTDGNVPTDLGILPHTIIETNDLRVGLVGLTTTRTPAATKPENVVDFNFIDYERALRETIPQVKAADIDLLMVISHVCMRELDVLVTRVVDLGIQLMGGGHCNELVAKQIDDTVVLGGGFHFTAYAKATFKYDTVSESIVDVVYAAVDNVAGTADETIENLVARWQQQTTAQLDSLVGYSAKEYSRILPALQEAVVNSWLWANPTADFALNNALGQRQFLPEGELRLADLIGFMPFDNTLYAVNLTGGELMEVIEDGQRPIVGGIREQGDGWIVTKTGEPLMLDTSYRVIVNSFQYAGGSGYGAIREYDPEGFDTGVQYRQPFVDWIRSLSTSAQNPLTIP
ncbi:MAG: bifunctional UDP-sugar hydrolase/5'-nucleotidase [Gammaproteobacteria bacterium]|nr:bifunctional UDP-sugar hydrolase/5'-nucleotidase [Gammaproteobacteria bacterium]HJO12650.1 bifunctional UDP-sugar hydrolase/5'-nucleotidase [Gammaproteobacteria bacterium]